MAVFSLPCGKLMILQPYLFKRSMSSAKYMLSSKPNTELHKSVREIWGLNIRVPGRIIPLTQRTALQSLTLPFFTTSNHKKTVSEVINRQGEATLYKAVRVPILKL